MRQGIKSGSYYPTTTYEDWISAVVEMWMLERRREDWPRVEDQIQDAKQEMLFSHDSIDLPPLAWTILFKNKYSNLFGRYVPDAIRRWGFVMWDAHRLDSGAKEYLLAEWETLYGNTDPRGPVEDQ